MWGGWRRSWGAVHMAEQVYFPLNPRLTSAPCYPHFTVQHAEGPSHSVRLSKDDSPCAAASR